MGRRWQPFSKELIAKDSRGHPPTKYKVLEDAPDWTANKGYPGHADAAIEESRNVITTMFMKASIGAAKPADAIKDAEGECKRIFSQWRETGLI